MIKIYLSLGNNKVIEVFQQTGNIRRYVFRSVLKDTAININLSLIPSVIAFILLGEITGLPLIGCLWAF